MLDDPLHRTEVVHHLHERDEENNWAELCIVKRSAQVSAMIEDIK